MIDLMNCVHHKLILRVWFTTMLLMYTCAQKGNAGVEGINGVKITESEKNPYSSEETVGFFMVDIFEAYRGCYIIEDYFEKEDFFYHDIFSPDQDEGYYMEWKVELVKMTGNTVLAEAVNHFHEILFENSVKEMKQLAQEGSGLFYMGEHVDFRHYSRNIHTIKCFYWGKVFTVVDVKNTHMPMIGGVSIISANFNVETGKKYELADLYEKDNYFEWILSEIEKRYPKQEYLVKNWKACFERNNFTFLMAEHGLVLVDNFSQNVELMEWECMENILNLIFMNTNIYCLTPPHKRNCN